MRVIIKTRDLSLGTSFSIPSQAMEIQTLTPASSVQPALLKVIDLRRVPKRTETDGAIAG